MQGEFTATAVDFGHGVTGELREWDGELRGLAYTHPRSDTGKPCEGWVPTHAADYSWTVESREPLALSPSLLCRTCGHHGFVRGEWVPA
ncbi:hypothetical protein [Glaciibacter superstes]|uniref:hypothetical protein n=1 Tax=Glaciibacter superstes TaxID=501023 RepID=UPI0003B3A41A|nr:hypothetical protein [Glaciibacter superstes]